MTHTTISFGEEEREWLVRRAEQEGISEEELIRRAIANLRDELERQSPETSIETILEETSGIWKTEDGLEYQRKLRDECRGLT
jgi:hypothetical protein